MTRTASKKRRERAERDDRIVQHFDERYGQDVNKLDKWHNLCEDVGVAPGPTITQRKKALERKYVNIVDFVAAQKAGHDVHVFNSFVALRNYINNNPRKIFPQERAKENPILKWMLIKL